MDAEAFVQRLQADGTWGHYPAQIQSMIRNAAAALDNSPATAQAFHELLGTAWELSNTHQERVIDLWTALPRAEDAVTLQSIIRRYVQQTATSNIEPLLGLWAKWTRVHTIASGQPNAFSPVAASGFDDGLPGRLLNLVMSDAFFDDQSGPRSLAQQQDLFDLVEFLDDTGQSAVVHMMTIHYRSLHRNTRFTAPRLRNGRVRPVMFDLDMLSNQPTLAHLKQWITLAPNGQYGTGNTAQSTRSWRSSVLTALLQELDDPNRFINQSNRGTCAMTTVAHRLCLLHPAEYARIATELVLSVPGVPVGTARLQDNTSIRPPADAWQTELNRSARSVTEILIQSALMNLWGQGTYVNSRPPVPGVTASGQSNDGFSTPPPNPRIATVASSVLRQTFRYIDQNHVQILAENVGNGAIMAMSRWGANGAHMFDVVFVSGTFFADNRTWIDRRAGAQAPGAIEGPNLRDLMIFWNPWGGITPADIAAGTTPGGLGNTGNVNPASQTAPTLRVVSGMAGMLGMPRAEVWANVYAIVMV